MPKDIKEIEYKKQNRLGWIAFFVLAIHFSLVLFSIVPKTGFTEKISDFSSTYVDPTFKQKWSMFAPCPTLENRVKIKYFFKNDTTDWIDPIKNVLATHKLYRLTYHGNIAVGYYNMLYWVKTKIDQLDIRANENLNFADLPALRNSKENRLLFNYVKGYANEQFNDLPIKSEIDISYKNVETETTIHYYFSNYK